MSSNKTENFVMLKDVTKPGDGPVVSGVASLKSYNLLLAGTGAVHAKVVIKGSNINKPEAFVELVTITLDGSTNVKESGFHDGPWSYYKFTVLEITGTNASLDGAMGA